MFVLLTVIPFGLSGARALLATSLVFFAAVKIFQGRYVQFVALSAVAAFFHASSLVASVIVFLAAVSTSRKTHRLSRSLLACLALGVGGVGLASQLTYGTLFGLLNRIPLLGKYTAYESVIDPDSAIPSLSAVLPYVAAQTGAKALLLLFVVALCLSHEKEDYFIDSPTLRLLVLSSLAIAFTLVSAFARIGQLLYPLLGVCLYCLPKRRSHDEAKISPIDLTLAAYSITYFCAFVLIANWTGFFPFSFIWEHD
jgi:hypothetical protein